MKTYEVLKMKRPMVALAIAGLLAAPMALDYIGGGYFDLIDQTSAANPDAGQGGQGAGKGAGGAGRGAVGAGQGAGGAGEAGGTGAGLEDKVFRSGQQSRDIAPADVGEEEDSDRPDWAQTPGREGKPGSGGGKPAGAGDKLGDLYGDLWMIVRDPVTGVPILSADGWPQPYYIDAEGNVVLIPLDEEGHPIDETLTVEVEFGRLNLGRAPTKVIDHALDEAMTKIVSAETLTLDAAGRIMVDSETTIDSPQENLALYIAIMSGDTQVLSTIDTKLEGFDADNPADRLDLAASLFAGAADKTGTISVDMVAYLNVIYGIAEMTPTDYVNYSSLSYDRSDLYGDVEITYNELNPDGTTVPVSGNILELVFGGTTVADSGGIDAFTVATDDALQVIEFIHESIHDLNPDPVTTAVSLQ